MNTGQFNLTSSTFVAPMDGIYYIFHRSSIHKGVETISGTTLLDLQAGDLVRLHLTGGQIHSSVQQHEMSFVGFLYSPKFVAGAAWVISLSSKASVGRGSVC